jgi:hypothetical protein
MPGAGRRTEMTLSSLFLFLTWTCLITAGGFLFVKLFGAGLTGEEMLAWSWGTGMLLLVVSYCTLLALHARPGPKKLSAILACFAVSALFVRRPPDRKTTLFDSLSWGFALFAAAGCLAYALQAVAEPLWSTDFLAMWGLKGKTIYFSGGVPERLFHDPAIVWSHPEYPLFVPLAMAAFSTATGGWNDEALGLLYAGWQIAAILIVVGYCRRRGSARAGSIAAALVAWFHPLYRGFGTGLADIPFAFAAVLLCSAAVDRNSGRVSFAAFLAAATKQEGLLLSSLCALIVFFFPSGKTSARRGRLCAILIAAAAGSHALLLRILRGPLSNRDFTLGPLTHPSDLAARVGRLATGLAGSLSGGLVVGIAATVGILFITRHSREDLLLVALGLQIAVYLTACALSSFDPVWQLQGFFRTSGALVPSMALAVGARIASSRSRSDLTAC